MLNCNEELVFKMFSLQSLALHWEAGPRESNENLSVIPPLKGLLNPCHGEEGASLELLSGLSLWKCYKVFNAWHRLQFSAVFHLLKDASVTPQEQFKATSTLLFKQPRTHIRVCMHINTHSTIRNTDTRAHVRTPHSSSGRI